MTKPKVEKERNWLTYSGGHKQIQLFPLINVSFAQQTFQWELGKFIQIGES